MKLRKLLVIAGVVFCLLILSFVKNFVARQEASRKDREVSAVNLTPGLAAGFVSDIIVYKGSDDKNKIYLRKDLSGKWVLENRFGLKARSEAVDSLLKELTDVSGEIRADSEPVFDDFGISDTSGVHVILKAAGDKVIKHIILGLKRPSWNMNFVRLAQDAKVIAAQKDILSRLNLYDATAKLDENYFADFKVLSLDTNKVERLEVKEANKQAIVLVKRPADTGVPLAWDFEPPVNGQDIDPAKIDGFLQNIANIYAQDSLDPSLNTYGFDRPSLEIKIFLHQDNLQPIKMDIGSYLEPQKAFFLRIFSQGAQGMVFRVPETFIQNLKKERPYFLKDKTAQKSRKK